VVLRLADTWVWDFWVADTGTEFHIYYLQAPKSLGEQIKRHWNATVGHAVSTDLRDWEVLGTALLPGPLGSWEDMATWTGSVLEHRGVWHMFYTGTRSTGSGVEQRVALATSTDLSTWTRHPANPLIELDPRWYERVEHDSWRDPWVLRDPGGDGFHALITARAREGAADARGVIGHAWSADLVEWEVRPPLSEPGEFGHMEVPQVEVVDGTPVLLFSVGPDRFGSARRLRLPTEASGTYVAIGQTLLGPWEIAGARRIPVPDLYSARLVRDRAGEWQVLGFIDGSERDAFVGELSDPIPFRELGLLPAGSQRMPEA
jgi:beta-fructofuranosidase